MVDWSRVVSGRVFVALLFFLCFTATNGLGPLVIPRSTVWLWRPFLFSNQTKQQMNSTWPKQKRPIETPRTANSLRKPKTRRRPVLGAKKKTNKNKTANPLRRRTPVRSVSNAGYGADAEPFCLGPFWGFGVGGWIGSGWVGLGCVCVWGGGGWVTGAGVCRAVAGRFPRRAPPRIRNRRRRPATPVENPLEKKRQLHGKTQ